MGPGAADVSEVAQCAEAAEAEVERLRSEIMSKSSSTPSGKSSSNSPGWIAVHWPFSWFKASESTSQDQRSWDSTDEVTMLKQRLKAKEEELEAIRGFARVRAAMKSKIQSVEKDMKDKYDQANSLDLVIAMDCTGSMAPWIHVARDEVINVINNVKGDHPGARVRVGFVAYRDFCDGSKRLEVKQLTAEIEDVMRFIMGLSAFGGGDGPEDIPGALQAAINMTFSADAKCIVVVADSPCHGNEYHDESDDLKYAAQIASSPSIRAQMHVMARTGIDFAFIEVQPFRTSKMTRILREEYRSVKPFDGMDRAFTVVELASALEVAKFADVVRTCASNSLSESKSRSVIASSKKPSTVSSKRHYAPNGMPSTALVAVEEAEEEDDDEDEREEKLTTPELDAVRRVKIAVQTDVQPLDWSLLDDQPELVAVRHTLHVRRADDIDWANLNIKHCTQATKIKLLPNCFAKGAMRTTHCMFDCKMDTRLVAKFYHGSARSTSATCAPNDVTMQVTAKYLAVQYSLNPQVVDPVDFIFTCWYEITDPRCPSSMRVFTAEPFIAGNYVKYNNNNGWINKKSAQLGETAQAFSHFTWEKTYGYLMVIDLQGVGSIFTDPQIHTMFETDMFGRGNMNQAGMARFFATHQCNAICKALDLTPFQPSSGEGADDDGEVTPRRPVVAPDRKMTCSCPLCGSILTVMHSEFIETYAAGREVYCVDCDAKLQVRKDLACDRCRQPTAFAPYWYEMKGMDAPRTCKACKRQPMVAVGA